VADSSVLCRSVFPGTHKALCFFHVRAATQKALQQKLRGVGEAKAAAYKAFNDFVAKVMYLPSCDTPEATVSQGQKMLADLKTRQRLEL
jgi:hypothetical protein